MEMLESQGEIIKYQLLENNITLYHGTDASIDSFDIEKARETVGDHHAFQGCLFFALNKELSAHFGKNIYKVLPNDLTALNLGNLQCVKEFADFFLNEMQKYLKIITNICSVYYCILATMGV